MDLGRAVFQRVFHVNDGGQLGDVDVQSLSRVARLLKRLSHDDGDLVAHVADLAHAQHAGHGFRRRRVDAVDRAMGHVRAHEIGVALVLQVDVVCVFAASRQEPQVFAPLRACADTAIFRHV